MHSCNASTQEDEVEESEFKVGPPLPHKFKPILAHMKPYFKKKKNHEERTCNMCDIPIVQELRRRLEAIWHGDVCLQSTAVLRRLKSRKWTEYKGEKRKK